MLGSVHSEESVITWADVGKLLIINKCRGALFIGPINQSCTFLLVQPRQQTPKGSRKTAYDKGKKGKKSPELHGLHCIFEYNSLNQGLNQGLSFQIHIENIF